MNWRLSLLIWCSTVGGVSSQNKNITWDYLIFTQFWPYSLCDAANLLKPDSCLIPKDVTTGWTIHGLWPTKDGEFGPESCIPADHFDMEKIKPILEELLHHWPNLIPSAPSYSLWQHEWTKHGTCAEQLASINGELKYFSSGLQLNERFAIGRILELAGIKPSDEPKYRAADITSALEKSKGKKFQVHCLKAKDGDETKWFLVDARACIDKELNQIDCPQPKGGEVVGTSEVFESTGIPDVEQCPPNQLLYYVVPRPDHFHSDEQHEMHSYAHRRDEYGDHPFEDDEEHRPAGEHDEL